MHNSKSHSCAHSITNNIGTNNIGTNNIGTNTTEVLLFVFSGTCVFLSPQLQKSRRCK